MNEYKSGEKILTWERIAAAIVAFWAARSIVRSISGCFWTFVLLGIAGFLFLMLMAN